MVSSRRQVTKVDANRANRIKTDSCPRNVGKVLKGIQRARKHLYAFKWFIIILEDSDIVVFLISRCLMSSFLGSISKISLYCVCVHIHI